MAGVRIWRGGNEHELCAQGTQRVLFLLALRFGHDDDRLIPKRVADQREANAGIASRAFDNRAAGLKQPLPFGIAYDVERSAVLYRCAGVHIFALTKNIASGFRAWPFKAHQRSVSNQIECRSNRVHTKDSYARSWVIASRSGPCHAKRQCIWRIKIRQTAKVQFIY